MPFKSILKSLSCIARS